MKTSRAESVLQTLLDTVNEAITIVDEDGTVTHWNRAAEELYRIPAAEIIGKNIADFGWNSLMIAQILKEGRPIRQAYHEPRPGTHVLVNTSPVVSGSTITGAISSEQDVTKLVRLGNKLFTAASQLQSLEKEITRYVPSEDPFFRIKGNGQAITHAIRVARRVSPTDATVLLTGESGVGKELFAHAIHSASSRAGNNFVAINCGAIPPALFESELFGYQGGSFTGADPKGRPGKLELAHKGTLFLDEVGELPLEMQVKLLRVLQERQFYRVGGDKPVKVDVRIIAATNRNLEERIAEGAFREDLYYRLNVVSVEIPPLRERIEDIPELLQYITSEIAFQYGKPVPRFEPEVIVALMNYSWPGNIRQLRNILERLVILTDDEVIRREHLPASIQVPRLDAEPQVSVHAPSGFRKEGHNEPQSELQLIQNALRTTYGNKAAAAKLLGISRGTLYNKMRKYGL
ncbi:sigma-54 interaction domain-containing protein [Effusibacillus lacus]|uniref:Sigma-54-dependent Fis family transcriptional regulator n=1 Tax=Effusibacillus lacus TaxID=1348429 RepID=A0A292YNC5_9BACL|nr:sigma 54-interacting transcriptional regulator [Effusibacillus lacus]TCS72262.1 PAS domain S-box-containing protein [Effusibacillus lacus]GAX90263.1 sigma-54-dependent Fis family transcriptional regulator [Effusibacillus lacus]